MGQKNSFAAVLLFSLLACLGCARTSQSDSAWGACEYPNKTSSLNGLGYVEKLCLQKGAQFKIVNRLSPRLDRADCLILVGDTLHPPAKEARDWIEEWLGKKSGRKVIYFGRDFDAAEYYMQQTFAEQPPERQLRASFDLARVRAQRDDLLLEQMNNDYFCRWFYTRVDKPQRVLKKFSGPWSEQLSDRIEWPVRAYLDFPDPALREDQPTWIAKPKPNIALRFPPRGRRVPSPVPPGTGATNRKRIVFTSVWGVDDINSSQEWEREWDLAPKVEKLLVGEDGTPLIMRLTSDRYAGSEILTLANGAALFNGMMVQSDWRKLCLNIATEIGDNARVAYLPYSESGIQVSSVPDADNEVAGLSVLTTWPLNILMAHLAFLGILICVALLPILGRPQNLKSSNVSDFGQHAEAMGQLMSRTRDLPFALRLVCDYLRIVRGEALPPWIESELAKHAPAVVIPPATPILLSAPQAEAGPEPREP